MKKNQGNLKIWSFGGHRVRPSLIIVMGLLMVGSLLLPTPIFGALLPTPIFGAWNEPDLGPPAYSAGEIDIFLNGSPIEQRKTGPLLIGSTGGSSKLCLNASTTAGVTNSNDPLTCVSSWSQALAIGGLGFLPLHISGGSGLALGGYAAEKSGYISLKAKVNQRDTLIVEPPAVVGRTFYGYVAPALPASYAGYFSGTLLIDSGQFRGEILPGYTTGYLGRLCLNGAVSVTGVVADWDPNTATGSCIQTWTGLFYAPPAIGLVKLQSGPIYTASTTPCTAPNQCGMSAVSQVGFMGSTVTGSTAGLPLAMTCGDGICSTNTSPDESAGNNCQIDCAQIQSPGFSVIPWNELNRLSITANFQAGPPQVRLLIVRRAGQAPTFEPQQGSIYAAGMVFGTGGNAETIVYSGQTNAGVVTNINDDDNGNKLINTTTYYYRAYQANLYPRFRYPGISQTAQPNIVAALRVAVSPSGTGNVVGSVGGSPSADGISCPSNCYEEYALNSTVTLDALDFGVSGTIFTHWEGACAGSGAQCILPISSISMETTAFFINCADNICSGTEEAALCTGGGDCGSGGSGPIGGS